ncbi:hypothetical protein IWX46DRAFT_604280, partial [Phyllosticta citricarpa]
FFFFFFPLLASLPLFSSFSLLGCWTELGVWWADLLHASTNFLNHLILRILLSLSPLLPTMLPAPLHPSIAASALQSTSHVACSIASRRVASHGARAVGCYLHLSSPALPSL